MLRNRYTVIGLGVVLFAVLAYNIFFVTNRLRGGDGQLVKAPPVTAAARTFGETRPDLPVVTERDTDQWKRDPFRYPAGKDGAPGLSKAKIPGQRQIVLQGIMTRNGVLYALLNGSVYGAGDIIGDLRIVTVKKYSVVVADKERQRVVYIYKDGLEKER